MAEKPAPKKNTSSKSVRHQVVDHTPIFGRINLILMVVGAAIIALGMFLMAGGKNADPNTFDYKEVYSNTRIVVAPLLIVLGLGVEVFAIFKKKG
ncbi:MAG: DUF3098 domain-containing protein [Bacteroidetes bacterium]|nr:MAG: DUF3098 domain-containing protein [Bacteroidota bacterium]